MQINRTAFFAGNEAAIPCAAKTLLTGTWMYVVLLTLLLTPCRSYSQSGSAASQPLQVRLRITESIDATIRIKLAGAQAPVFRNGVDLGRMNPATHLGPLFLVLKKSPEQAAALDALLDAQQERSSPSYHQWLSPEEFGKHFGLNDADIQTVVDWLTNQGFTVADVPKGRLSLTFSGTVAQVEQSFRTEMHYYQLGDERHYSNVSVISIPRALAPVVDSVASLNDLKPRTHLKASTPLQPASHDSGSVTPDYTNGSGGHFISPGDFSQIYNTAPLLVEGIDGNGQTIAIVGSSSIIQVQDPVIKAFRQTLLPNYNAVNTNVFTVQTSSNCPAPSTGTTDNEAYLDTEWAGAVAPRATIAYFASGNLYCAAQEAVEMNIASVLSMSFNACEGEVSSGQYTFMSDLWAQAAAQGTSAFVSAGDNGSAGCDDAHSDTVAIRGYGVNSYASTAYNIAVGGTEFFDNSGGYWTSNRANTLLPFTSAVGYIPEEVWNESGAVNGGNGIWAGGGGISQCTSKPGWQIGPGVPPTDPISVPIYACNPSSSAPHRYLPDVSLSSASHDGYILCNTSSCGASNGQLTNMVSANGTSVASPTFAGIQALIDEQYGRQGLANYVYYHLAIAQENAGYSCDSTSESGPDPHCVFNDITGSAAGSNQSNGVPCTVGGNDCPTSPLANYSVGPGYDLATGLGSVNVYNLFNQWNSETLRSADTAIQSVTPSNGTASYGAAVTLEAAVSIPIGAWGPPLTGQSVAFTDQSSGQTIGTEPMQLDITSETYTATFSTSSLSVGTHNISANCQLTGVYTSYYICMASSPVTVTVIASGTAPTAITGSATSLTSTNATLNGTVNPNGAATQYQFLYGTSQTLAGASMSGPYSLASGTSSQPVYATISGLSASKTYYYELQAWNSANSSSNPTNGGILSFTTPSAAKSTPLVSVAPSSQSITTTQVLAVSVVVVGNSATPTGSVTLSGGGYNSSAPLTNGSVLFNISAGQLLAGSDTLTATYTPDSASSTIYNSATGNTTVSVTTPGKLTPTVAVTPLSTNITTAQGLTVNVTVYTTSGSTSPTGNVTVTIGSYTSQAMPLTNASTSVYISGSSLSPGTYTPTAHYSGDTSFNSSSGTANNSVTVTAAPTATLTVSVTGSGSVTSNDGHINCPGTCSYGYAFGTSVLLIANEASGYYYQWSGCDGIDGIMGGCMLTMNQTRSVGIVFTQQPKGIMLVQPSGLTFYSWLVGTQSYTQTEFVISNGSAAALDQIFASVGGPNANDFAMTNNCPTYGLNDGNECTISVTFTPGGIGTRTASLTVSSANATITPQVLPLSGAGVVNPTVLVTSSPTGITAAQAMTLDVSVSGNYGTPTGSLRLNGGGYKLTDIPLTNGSAVITIPASSLAPGSDAIWIYYDPDTTSSTIYNGASASVSVTVAGATSYSAPTESIGTQSPTQIATVLFANSVTPGSITVTTLGAANLDFNLASGGTCAAGTAYTAGQTCTVNYTFTPSAPGTRIGAINVYDNASPSPNLASTIYLSGIGTGPQVAFSPSVQSTVLPLIIQSNPGGIAVDGSGNLYIADYDNNEVLKESLSGGKYTESTIGSGWNSPRAIAVDGAGNVLVAESGMNRVVMETPSGGSYVQTTVASGLGYPSGVAVDGGGNVYIADSQNNQILMETLTAGGYVQSTIPTNGLSWPNGIAVDGSGNIYIADQYNNRVLKETLSGGSYTQSIIISGLNNPRGVAVDANGNVYIADSQDDQVVKETPSASGYVESTIGSGVSYPCWVTLDGSGNLFISGYNLLKEDVSDPPSISFESTASGSTSTDSPKTITLANVGNAPLTFPVPSSGSNPSISPNFTLDASTSCPQLSANSAQGTLSAGATCVYALDFSPTEGGNISGSLQLGDNNLNAANGTQTISLSGVGMWVATITVNPASSGITTTQVLPVTVTVSGGAGSPMPTGTVTVSSGSYTSFGGTLSGGSATINIPAGSLAAGSDTLTAAYTPDSSSSAIYTAATGSSPSPVTVSKATPTVTVTPGSSSITTTQALSVTVAVSGGSGSPTATGSVALSSGSYTSAATSLTSGSATINILAGSMAAGSDTLSATYTPDTAGSAVYAGATGSTSSPVTVGKATPTVTVSPSASSITTAQALAVTVGVSGGTGNLMPTGSVTLSGGGYTSAAATLNNGSASINIPAGKLATGSDALTASYTPDSSSSSTYSAATGAATITVTTVVQTITFPAITGTKYALSQLSLSATASSGLPVTIVSTTPAVCTVSGSTASLLIGGTCTLQASQAGNADYGAAPMVSQSFMVHMVPQTISFSTLPSQPVGANAKLTATASSGLAVSFVSETSTVCTVSGATASMLATGSCVIHATQAGNGVYSLAPTVSQDILVRPFGETITFPAITVTQYAASTLGLSATASSGLAVSFASTTPAVCTVSGTTASLLSAGSCILKATQAGDTLYAAAIPVTQSFAVHLAPQTITFETLLSQAIGANVHLTATASSGLAVSFASATTSVCTVAGATASMLTTGTCVIHATQAGNTMYSAAPLVSQDILVRSFSQTIAFPAITATEYALLQLPLSATASSGLTVAFASTTPAVCTVSGTTASLLMAGSCILHATQAGNAVYAAATPVTQVVVVHLAAQRITFPAIASQVIGANLTLSATASSGLAVSFTSATSTTCSVAGTTASMLATGTCVIHATQAGNGVYSAAPLISESFTVKLAQSITFPAITATEVATTALGLSATASSGLTVSFTSTTPTVCTVSGTTASLLISGTCTIQATQAGGGAYGPATPVSQSLVVHHQTQTITFTPIASPQYVLMNLSLLATASSGLPVSFASATTLVCTVAGTTASMVSTGTCVIHATQAGNAAYSAASLVSQDFTVKPN